MDAERFDSLATMVASLTTRRGAFALLASLGLGVLDVSDAETRKSGRCKPKCAACEKCKKGPCRKSNSGEKTCRKGRCRPKPLGTPCPLPTGGSGSCQNGTCCPGGLTNCGGTCVNTSTDETNCGTCSAVCGATQVCQEGSCFPASTCPPATTSICVDPNAECGATCECGRSAEGNVLCLESEAFCTTPPRPTCTTSASCPAGQACVDVSTCCNTPLPAGSKVCLPRCAAPTA